MTKKEVIEAFEGLDDDAQIFESHIVDGGHNRFGHSGSVVYD